MIRIIFELNEISTAKRTPPRLHDLPAEGVKRIMKPMENVGDALRDAITGALVSGKLTCQAAWEIAADLKVSRMDVCSAADALNIKTTSCQLGAF